MARTKYYSVWHQNETTHKMVQSTLTHRSQECATADKTKLERNRLNCALTYAVAPTPEQVECPKCKA